MSTAAQCAPTTTLAPPAPWGSSPTPLLPRWYINAFSSTPLPLALVPASARRAASGALLRTVGDLPRFWEHRVTPLGDDLLRLLVGLVQHRQPPAHYVVLPAGVDPARLLACPLRTRAGRCLQRAILRQAFREDQTTTVGELLALPHFGIGSLLDVMCIAEAALGNRYLSTSRNPATSPQDSAVESPSEPEPDPALALQQPFEPPAVPSVAWASATVLLKRLLAASLEFQGIRTLGDALDSDLTGLATTMDLTDDLDSIPISDLASGPSLAEEVLAAIDEQRESESLSPVERLILEQRLLAPQPRTLEEVGRGANLTRERIRQLERPLSRTIESTVGRRMEVIASLIREKLNPVVTESDLEERICSTFPTISSPDSPDAATDIARHFLRAGLDYSCVDGTCLSNDAIAVVDELRGGARSLADDAGLVEVTDLQAHLPNDDWQQYWDVLVDRCSLHRLGGRLALRDTAKARAKAALLTIGAPATKEEVAELSGLDPDRAGAQLSLLPSVVRADKVRWGLAEWIADEYEGIPAEIVQRINEDGGSTRLDRLLDEIPRRFGVSANSVKAYGETPAFRIEHGWVSVADDSSIIVGRFEDVSSGRDSNDDPYWIFPMHERYLQGYSISGVPPELAVTLGCKLGGTTKAIVRAPAGARNISVIWRRTSIRGPEIGRIADALTAIAARDGDSVCIVVHSGDEVSFVPYGRLAPTQTLTRSDPRGPAQSPTDGVGGSRYTGVRVAGRVRGKLDTTQTVPSDSA